MGGYYGTAEQQRLQRKAEGHAGWAARTPGACNAGRLLGTDDPELLGWSRVLGHLATDRAFAFRMVPGHRVLKYSYRLDERGYGFCFFDVFQARADNVLRAARDALADGLPEGMFFTDPGEVDDALVRQCQECMVRNGVVPFYGALLAGRHGAAALVAVRNAEGRIVATGFSHMPHNEASPHHRAAWGGLVAVDKAERGRRLGVAVNAMLAERAVSLLGAERLYQLVPTTSTISRRMIARSGLIFDPETKCAIATEAERRPAH